jgi:heptosyltransferase-1
LRILVVKLSSLGDVIQTLPVLHDLTTQFPGVEIDWVVEEAFADLLRQVPGLGRVLPCAQRRWRKTPFASDTRAQWRHFWATLRQEAYDVVIDFQGLIKSARVARGARLTDTGFSVTYGNRSELCAYEWPVRWMLDRTVPMDTRLHAVARTRQLAARALGYDHQPMLRQAPVYPFARLRTSAHKAVFFAHGTTREDNEWPQSFWLAVGQRCIDDGFEVWIPQANDREQALALCLQHALGDAVRVLPRSGLAELLHVMASCQGVLGVDSGLSHLAVALDLPVVQIFSQPRAWRAGPVGQVHQCAVGGDKVPSVQEVWDAWARCLLAAQAVPQH